MNTKRGESVEIETLPSWREEDLATTATACAEVARSESDERSGPLLTQKTKGVFDDYESVLLTIEIGGTIFFRGFRYRLKASAGECSA